MTDDKARPNSLAFESFPKDAYRIPRPRTLQKRPMKTEGDVEDSNVRPFPIGNPLSLTPVTAPPARRSPLLRRSPQILGCSKTSETCTAAVSREH